MSQTMDAAREFLKADQLRFTEVGDGLTVSFADEDGRWSAMLIEVNGCFVCTSAFPVNVPEEHRPAAAELVTRMNWPLLIGNWEMDLSDGEVRYRTSMPVRSAEMTADLCRDLCYTNFGTFTRGWRPLMAISTGAATPTEALDAARAAASAERKSFDETWRKMGFGPDEDPFRDGPSPDADGEKESE